jgi:hypothetical protein
MNYQVIFPSNPTNGGSSDGETASSDEMDVSRDPSSPIIPFPSKRLHVDNDQKDAAPIQGTETIKQKKRIPPLIRFFIGNSNQFARCTLIYGKRAFTYFMAYLATFDGSSSMIERSYHIDQSYPGYDEQARLDVQALVTFSALHSTPSIVTETTGAPDSTANTEPSETMMAHVQLLIEFFKHRGFDEKTHMKRLWDTDHAGWLSEYHAFHLEWFVGNPTSHNKHRKATPIHQIQKMVMIAKATGAHAFLNDVCKWCSILFQTGGEGILIKKRFAIQGSPEKPETGWVWDGLQFQETDDSSSTMVQWEYPWIMELPGVKSLYNGPNAINPYLTCALNTNVIDAFHAFKGPTLQISRDLWRMWRVYTLRGNEGSTSCTILTIQDVCNFLPMRMRLRHFMLPIWSY